MKKLFFVAVAAMAFGLTACDKKDSGTKGGGTTTFNYVEPATTFGQNWQVSLSKAYEINQDAEYRYGWTAEDLSFIQLQGIGSVENYIYIFDDNIFDASGELDESSTATLAISIPRLAGSNFSKLESFLADKYTLIDEKGQDGENIYINAASLANATMYVMTYTYSGKAYAEYHPYSATRGIPSFVRAYVPEATAEAAM